MTLFAGQPRRQEPNDQHVDPDGNSHARQVSKGLNPVNGLRRIRFIFSRALCFCFTSGLSSFSPVLRFAASIYYLRSNGEFTLWINDQRPRKERGCKTPASRAFCLLSEETRRACVAWRVKEAVLWNARETRRNVPNRHNRVCLVGLYLVWPFSLLNNLWLVRNRLLVLWDLNAVSIPKQQLVFRVSSHTIWFFFGQKQTTAKEQTTRVDRSRCWDRSRGTACRQRHQQFGPERRQRSLSRPPPSGPARPRPQHAAPGPTGRPDAFRRGQAASDRRDGEWLLGARYRVAEGLWSAQVHPPQLPPNPRAPGHWRALDRHRVVDRNRNVREHHQRFRALCGGAGPPSDRNHGRLLPPKKGRAVQASFRSRAADARSVQKQTAEEGARLQVLFQASLPVRPFHGYILRVHQRRRRAAFVRRRRLGQARVREVILRTALFFKATSRCSVSVSCAFLNRCTHCLLSPVRLPPLYYYFF